MKNAVIVLNYNDYETTSSFINHIINYKSIDYIVVVDNCSTDKSYNQLKSIESNKVIVIKSDKNGGYGYGNNYGIKYAYNNLKVEYLLISNPDVEFTEDTFKSLKNYLVSHENVAVASAIMLTPSGEVEQASAWKVTGAFKLLLSSIIIFNKLFKVTDYSNDHFKNKNEVEVDCVSGSMLMVNAFTMINHGMYDEEIFLYGEETVLGIKFKEAGFKTVQLQNNSFIHRHSVSISKSFKTELKRRKLLFKSRIIILKKYYNLSKFKMFMAKLMIKLALIENRIIFFIKRI